MVKIRKATAKVRLFSRKKMTNSIFFHTKQKNRPKYFVFWCFFRYFAVDYGVLTTKNIHTMNNSMKKNLGICLVVLGAVLLILPNLFSFMGDLLDQNVYTAGSALLVIAGIIVHIWMNKTLPLDDEKEED